MKLKKLYSSRDVAAQTGLSARQLQWWDRRGVFVPAIPTRPTERGGFTERRYTSLELLELMVLADLRRRGFSLARLRRLLQVLRARFNARLYEAIEGGGPITLFIDRDQVYGRARSGELFNLLEHPEQPLLMVGEDLRLRELTVRESPARRGARMGKMAKSSKFKVQSSKKGQAVQGATLSASARSGTPSRGRRRGVE
jgi:DNA-binding transcriptional MerR regulator